MSGVSLRARTVTLCTTTLAVGLTACGLGGSPDADDASPEPDEVTTVDLTDLFEPVSVDAELTIDSPQVASASVVGSTPDLPGLIVARADMPDGPPALLAWRVGEGSGAAELDLGVEAPSALDTVGVTASDTLTAIAGSWWVAGAVVPFVLTSTDRTTWEAVALPEELGGTSLDDAVVTDSVVTAVGTDAAGETNLTRIEGGEVTVTPVTGAPAGEREAATVAVSGDEILVVSRDVPDGGRVVAWLSTDAGATFARVEGLPRAELTSLSGTVHDGREWVIVGTRSDPDGNDRPIALTSSDTEFWRTEAEFLVADEDWTPWSDGVSHAVVSAPTVGPDGQVQVTVSASNRAYGGVYQRSEDHWFYDWGVSNDDDAFPGGPGFSGQVAANHDGTYTVLRWAEGLLQLAEVDDGAWRDIVSLTTRSAPHQLYRHALDVESNRLVARYVDLEVYDDGWSRPSSARGLTLTDSSLRADGELTPQIEIHGNRQVVRIDWTGGPGGTRLEVRARDDADWEPADVDISDITSFQPPRWAAERWIVAVSTRPSSSVSSGHSQLSIVTSHDGETWQRWSPAEIGFDGPGGSAAHGVCPAPGGGFLVVGQVETGLPSAHAAVWLGGDDGVRLLEADTPAGSGFDACALVGEESLLRLSTPGTEEIWALTDDDPEQRAVLPPDLRLGELSAGEKLLSVGTVWTDGHQGPAVLISDDGTQWSWLPVPAQERALDDAWLADTTDGTFVIGNTGAGPRAWRITDMDALVAAAVPLEES